MDQHGENDIFSHLYPLSKLHEGAPQSFVLTCYFEMKHSCVCLHTSSYPPPTSPAQHLAWLNNKLALLWGEAQLLYVCCKKNKGKEPRMTYTYLTEQTYPVVIYTYPQVTYS